MAAYIQARLTPPKSIRLDLVNVKGTPRAMSRNGSEVRWRILTTLQLDGENEAQIFYTNANYLTTYTTEGTCDKEIKGGQCA